MRRLAMVGFAAVLIVGATGCGKDEKKAEQSDRPPVSFVDPPEGSMKLGLCLSYPIADIKELMGGNQYFKRLMPTAIGQEGDDVTGESCAWERTDPNGATSNLRIEVRDFGEDTAGLEKWFADLKSQAKGFTAIDGLGDDAFSVVIGESLVLQARSGQYLLTASSQGSGGLAALSVEQLTELAFKGIGALP